MYVITGATGKTGSVVANRLLDAGAELRVIARHTSTPYQTFVAQKFVAAYRGRVAA